MSRRAIGASYYASKRGYYCVIGGRRICLLKGERTPENDKEANARFHRQVVAIGAEIDGDRLPCKVIVDQFMTDAKHRIKPSTWDVWHYVLKRFVAALGDTPVNKLRPAHVSDWLIHQREPRVHPVNGSAVSWGNGTIRIALTAIKGAFTWAKAGGRITINPVESLKKPPSGKRADAITAEQHARIMQWIPAHWRDFFTMLFETGARPFSELAAARGSDYNPLLKALVIRNAKRKRPSIVRLTAKCIEIVTAHGDGLLFPSKTKQSLSKDVIAKAMRRYCVRLEVRGLTVYSYRHGFATDALRKRVPIAELAILMNTSVRMIEETYSHLIDHGDLLHSALNTIRNAP